MLSQLEQAQTPFVTSRDTLWGSSRQWSVLGGLVVLALVLLVSSGLRSCQLLRQHTQSQLDVLASGQLLLSATQAMHLFQGWSLLANLRDAPNADPLPLLAQQAQQNLQALKQNFEADPLFDRQLQDIQTQWSWIEQNAQYQDAEARYAAQLALIQQVQTLQKDLADAGMFMADTDRATAELLDLVLDTIPDLLNHLSLLRAYSTALLAETQFSDLHKQRLWALKGYLEHDLSALQTSVVLLQSSQPDLYGLLAQIQDQLGSLVVLFESQVIPDLSAQRPGSQPQEWFNAISEPLDASYALVQQSLMPGVQQQLQQQLTEQRTRYWLTLIAFAVSVLLLIAVLLFVGWGLRRHLTRYGHELLRMQSRAEVYQDVFQGLRSGVLICSQSGEIVALNSAAIHLFGVEGKSDLLGKNWSSLAPETQLNSESSAAYFAALAQKVFQNQCVECECVLQRNSGEPFYATLQLGYLEMNRQPHLFAEIRDISLLKQDVTELKTSEARARAMLRSMSDAVVMIDTVGKMIVVNDAITRLFDYEEDELLGQNVSMLMPEPHRSMHDEYLRERAENFNGGFIIGRRVEVEAMRKDSSLFPIELSVNELFDDLGTTFIGVIRDISERKAIEEAREQALQQAEHLAQAKSDFMANMSHEIRTPLNSIIGLAKIASRTQQLKNQRDTCKRIHSAGMHLLGLVNDILDYSKIEAGKMQLDPQPFRLSSVIEDVVQMADIWVKDKELELSVVNQSQSVEWVMGDALRLKQILINLLSNAVKFTEFGGISLMVRRDGAWWEFIIDDTGIGISEAQMKRLFLAFEQADASTTRRFGGSGLGLAISANLAHLMGGEITVSSAPEQGSQFKLRVLLPETDAGQEITLLEPIGSRLKGYRILAVDDSELNRIVLEDALVHEGAHVEFAESGQQALLKVKNVERDAYDLVLMDIQMPEMDGYHATQCLHAVYSDLPVIALTAHAMSEERQRCLDVGMLERVTKPIDVDVLVEVIRRCVPLRTNVTSSVVENAKTPSCVDWAAVRQRYDHRDAFVTRLIDNALDGSQADNVRKLRKAAVDQDWDTIKFAAHAIKGMTGVFQAKTVQTQAEQTEQAAVNHQPRAADLACDLADRVEDLLNELKHYREQQVS